MSHSQVEIPGALPTVANPGSLVAAGVIGLDRESLAQEVQRLRPLTLKMEQEAAALEIVDAATKTQATEQVAVLTLAIKAADARKLALVTPLRKEIADIEVAFGQIIGPARAAAATLGRKLIDRQRALEAEQRLEEQAAALARRAETLRLETIARAEAANEPKTLEEFFAQEDARPPAGPVLAPGEAVLDFGGHPGGDPALSGPPQGAKIGTMLDPYREVGMPVRAPEPAPARRTETSGGATVEIKKNMKWEVTALSEVPEEYLKPRELDRAKITRVVKAGVQKIPGLRIWDDGSLAVQA